MRRPLLAAAVLPFALLAGCTPSSSTSHGQPAAATSASPAAPPPPDFSAWVAGRSTPVADTIYPERGNPGVDVYHYGLDLAWEPTTKTLTGKATVQLRATEALTGLKLDFSKAYTIDSVTLDGKPVDATVTGEKLGAAKLEVATALPAEGMATLVVSYHGMPTQVPMPSHRPDSEPLGLTVTAAGELWTMQEPYGAATWYPVNDQPSDKALYDISITVPAGWAAVASGTPAESAAGTYKYTTTDAVSSYLTTLAVGKYQKVTAAGPHGLPLTYWYRPGVDDKWLKLLQRSPEALTWLESKFGPYPFPSAGAVLVDGKSAMETEQMVTIGHMDMPAKANPADYHFVDLLHEYAHQWFGDSVGPSTWKDVWLNEGWATYAQDLYVLDKLHAKVADFEKWARGMDKKFRADSGPPGSPKPDKFAEGNVYICPELMLHEIHKKIGDTAFFSLAKDWAAQHKNTSQDRAGFTAFVNQHTGQDLTALINLWLDSPTTPK